MSRPTSPTSRTSKRRSLRSLFRSCGLEKSDTEEEADFGNMHEDELASVSAPAAVDAGPRRPVFEDWSRPGRQSTVSMPLGTTTSWKAPRHTHGGEPTMPAIPPAHTSQQSWLDDACETTEIDTLAPPPTAQSSARSHTTTVPEHLDPSLYQQSHRKNPQSHRKNLSAVSKVPKNARTTEAFGRPHRSGVAGLRSNRPPSPSRSSPGRPESTVLGQGPISDENRDSPDSFGADNYFRDKPLPPLPIDPKLPSLQSSRSNLSRLAILDSGSTATAPTSTPSENGESPRLPSGRYD